MSGSTSPHSMSSHHLSPYTSSPGPMTGALHTPLTAFQHAIHDRWVPSWGPGWMISVHQIVAACGNLRMAITQQEP
jgi:hypothetical protein